MTKLVVIFSTVIILIGCADDQGIVQLYRENTEQIFLTAKRAVTRTFETKKTIEGSLGGEIDFDMQSSGFGVMGNLEIPEFSFVDQEQVTISIPEADESTAILEIRSSNVSLEKPIMLSVKFTGLNIDDGDIINFNYIDEKGMLNDVEYGRLIISYEEGWVLVVNAKVYQFARYGFTRKTVKL